MEVRNNFGNTSRQCLQERLAIRRVLLQDQEALAKAKAGIRLWIWHCWNCPTAVIAHNCTSFSWKKLDSESSHFVEVEIDLLSSLCDHPHIVHFQGAQIFSRGGPERVFSTVLLLVRELRSYKKFIEVPHLSFFFGAFQSFPYSLSNNHYFYVNFVSIFSIDSAFRRFTDVYSLYIGFWVCAAETVAACHTRRRILWGCVHICFSAQTRCSLWALPHCRFLTSHQGIVSWRNTSFTLGDCNAVSCEEGCTVPWHFKRLFHEIR